MGNKTLIYKAKVEQNLKECFIHLERLEDAFLELQKQYSFLINVNSYKKILENRQDLAFCDQIIYRFSKLQDTMGAKLFKSLLLYQGENINKPFLDILNTLEKIDIIEVEEWFKIRDLRNEIAHDYEDNENRVVDILNTIYELKEDLQQVLYKIQKIIKAEDNG